MKTSSLPGTGCQSESFDQLLGIVQNSLRKQCTKFVEPISAEEQLVITIM